MTQHTRTAVADPAVLDLAVVDPAVVDLAPTPDAARARQAHHGDTGTADTAMTIGEVAREFGVTLRALRFYESRRLIAPLRSGTSRHYGRADRERLALILAGRRLGFTLAEIRQLLDRPDASRLRLTRAQCIEQINLLERQKRGIECALGELRRIYTSFYKSLPDDQHRC